MGRAFVHLIGIDRGYNVKGIVTVNVSLEGTRHQSNKRQLAYFEEVLGRLQKMPDVRSASATEFLPLYASAFVGGPFGLDGRPAKLNSTMIPVMAGYFETVGARILAGREFSGAEVRSGAKVAMVNERFAEGFGGPENIVGHQLTMEGDAPKQIVGVVKGMEYETDPSLAGSQQVFVPSETPGSFYSTFVASVNGRAADRLAEIRAAIESVDPQVPVFGVKTMEQRLDEIFARPKLYRAATWMFAGLALLLALMGVYGMVAAGVVRRTKEMGVRMVLGSTSLGLREMLVRESLMMVGIGVLLGIAMARLTGRALGSLVEGATAVDMASSAGLVACFLLMGMASAWMATRKIAKLDVMEVLRAE